MNALGLDPGALDAVRATVTHLTSTKGTLASRVGLQIVGRNSLWLSRGVSYWQVEKTHNDRG
jgi:hypothetical protein